jgi:ATP-dependent DNA helicase RecQ
VAHLDLPKSLEAYYQETGRAGRDGLPAEAWMVYGLGDIAKQHYFIDESEAEERHKRIERQKLAALLGFCETIRCRRQVLLEYLGDGCEPCGNCDTCLDPVEGYDGTVEAQKALSCVYRTGQVFGAAHVIQVLLGKSNQRIERYNHHQLSTFGIGQEHTQKGWNSIFRQLTANNLLVVDTAGHGGLRLGPDSREVLRGERTVQLRKETVRKKRRTRSRAGRPTPAAELASADQELLFQALRDHRLRLAKEQGVPPYVIFHDSTLVSMVQVRPHTLEQMAAVSGVGQAKLDRYGQEFLDVINQHDGGAED